MRVDNYFMPGNDPVVRAFFSLSKLMMYGNCNSFKDRK